jgi:hypothetical protein
VLVIDEQSVADWKRLPLKFSAYPVGLVKESFTFRREDLYVWQRLRTQSLSTRIF